MARDNVDVIEAAWAAWAKGDIQGVTRMIAPEAEIRLPDALPWGGTYIGPEGCEAMLGAFVSHFTQLKATPAKVLGADDEHVVVVAQARGRTRSGNALEVEIVWIYRFRDGQVESAHAFTDTAYILEKLG